MEEQVGVKIKVAFLLFDADYVTSTHKIVDLLISQLDRKKFDPCVICFLPTARQVWSGAPIYSLHSSPRAAVASAFRLARLFKEKGIQVAVSSNTGPNLATAAAKVLGRGRVKIILIEHNTFSVHEGKNHIKKFIAGKLYPQADLIIGVSKGVSRDLAAVFPQVTSKTKTIYNCLLTSSANLKKLAEAEVTHPWFQPKTLPLILNVGELFPRKGQDTLIQAFASMRKTMAARLIIVGTLIEPTHENLKSVADGLGIAEDVAFLGYQDNPFKYMSQADVFVLSSREEGFGLVLIEAMACGCPVVSTDCPYGPDEIIIPEHSGLLVPVDDPEAMANAMIRVLEDTDLSLRLRQGGTERMPVFDRQHFVKNYEDIIKEMVQP
jgi:glycosyltransferase involved in cell wall biosynthesis